MMCCNLIYSYLVGTLGDRKPFNETTQKNVKVCTKEPVPLTKCAIKTRPCARGDRLHHLERGAARRRRQGAGAALRRIRRALAVRLRSLRCQCYHQHHYLVL